MIPANVTVHQTITGVNILSFFCQTHEGKIYHFGYVQEKFGEKLGFLSSTFCPLRIVICVLLLGKIFLSGKYHVGNVFVIFARIFTPVNIMAYAKLWPFYNFTNCINCRSLFIGLFTYSSYFRCKKSGKNALACTRTALYYVYILCIHESFG